MSTKPICIMGFMGVGKTRWGKLLANRFKLQFVDLDKLIESNVGMNISDIFLSQGEEQFRELESECLREILNQNDTSTGSVQALVASLGGGTACSDENINLLKEKAFTIYLKANAGMLHSRLVKNYKSRPLLAKHSEENLLEVITDLLSQREKYYNQADVIVDVEKLTIEKLAALVQTR